jgi:carbonic anhydrase
MDIVYRYDPYAQIVPRQSRTAKAAMRELEEGHRRFRKIVAHVEKELLGSADPTPMVIPSSPLARGFPVVGVPLQVPYALFLGCSDARAPIEHIFDQSSNDLFVIRVAGNVLGTECLGSIDYAVQHLKESLKLLVVLGHTRCGAVSAAVDSYLSPHDYSDIAFTHALRSLVDRIHIAVRGASKSLERVFGTSVKRKSSYRDALLEVAVYLNAALTAFDVRRETQTVADSSVRVVYGVFDLADQRVHALPHREDTPDEAIFGQIPKDADGFTALGDTLAQGVKARGIL